MPRAKMIVVTDVKTAEFGYEELCDLKMTYNVPYIKATWGTAEGDILPDITVSIEQIEGVKHINANGEEVIIGMSQAVQDTIGLPMRTFEDPAERIFSLDYKNLCLTSKCNSFSREKVALESSISSINNLSFWWRLVFLFTKKWDWS